MPVHPNQVDTKPTLYINWISGPSRSIVLILKKFGKLDQVEIKNLEIGTDTRTAEYTAINPFNTVPALAHGDIKLYESTAILEYLNDLFGLVGDYGFAHSNSINNNNVDGDSQQTNNDKSTTLAIQQKYKQINILHKYHNLLQPAHRNVVVPFYPAMSGDGPFQLDVLKTGLEKSKKDYYPLLETLLATNGGFLAGNKPSAVDVHYWVDMFFIAAPTGSAEEKQNDVKYTLNIYNFEKDYPYITKWLNYIRHDKTFFDVELYDAHIATFVDYIDGLTNGIHQIAKDQA